MCRVGRGYDVAGVGGGEFALRLASRQRVAPFYWRSDTHTHTQITHRLEACTKELIFYQEHRKRFRRKHLKNGKKIAQEQDVKEAFTKISAIIQWE
jgi:hypothetical protein